jgi:hypothetical protein
MTYTPEEITQKLDAQRHQVDLKTLNMSLSEVQSWIDKGRLILNPIYQRLFVWKDDQQSKLIESILLGLPLPPIFGYRIDGKGYEIIDGVQRLNTIKRFFNNELKLEQLVVLDFCNDLTYNTLPEDVQITFDTSRLDAVFLEKGSSEEAKYELFVRLNTGGKTLERQQVRDCYILASENGTDYFKNVIEKLAKLDVFQESLTLSDTQEKNSFSNELVIRFLTIANPQYTESLYKKSSAVNLHDWLDKQILERIKRDSTEIRDLDIDVFTKTFKILSQLDGDALRRFDIKKNKFVGNTTLKAFELVAIGIGNNIYKDEQAGLEYNLTKEELLTKIKDLWQSVPDIEGYAGFNRILDHIKKGCDFFKVSP